MSATIIVDIAHTGSGICSLARIWKSRLLSPKKMMMGIIHDIIKMGVKAVTFSGGGEPFCYPYLLDTANKLAESPVKFAVLSNGSRLTGELAKLFAHHGTWLRVSIEGWDEKSYSYYRSVPDGEFNKVIRNMESFKKLGGKCYLVPIQKWLFFRPLGR